MASSEYPPPWAVLLYQGFKAVNVSLHRLSSIRLFRGFDGDWLRALEQKCGWLEFDREQTILDRDNREGDVFFVTQGSVIVVNFSVTGREIALARIAAGSYFGELAAIDGEPRSASVVALEPCVIGVLAPQAFSEAVTGDATLSLRLMRRLARIIRISDDRIMDLSTLGAFQRVYLELLRLSHADPDHPESLVIDPMPGQKDIASQASTTRETVTRAISQLVAGGIVERSRKRLSIVDQERFKSLATDLDPDWGEDGVR